MASAAINQAVQPSQPARQKAISEKKKTSEEAKEKQKKKQVNKTTKTVTLADVDNLWQCAVCGEEYHDEDSKLLECEVCSQHVCSKCLEMGDGEYCWLTNREDLHWYCKTCEAGALLSIKTDKDVSQRCTEYFKVMEEKLKGIGEKLNQKADKKYVMELEGKIERQLSEKVDITELDSIDKRIRQIESNLEEDKNMKLIQLQKQVIDCDKKLEDHLTDITVKFVNLDKQMEGVKRLEELLGEETNTVETNAVPQKPLKWADIVVKDVETQMKGVAVEVSTLQEHVRELQEDKEEQEEINKRKQGVIMHGLKEPLNASSELRKKEDEEAIIDLLHQIQCDDVSVNVAIRLGKQPDGPEAKPRPIKIVLQSEAQKEKVLKSAKNLRVLRNGLEKVFIHQDLTPKQRKIRQQLVKELKERQTQGEQNLIIVGEKIVTRRLKT